MISHIALIFCSFIDLFVSDMASFVEIVKSVGSLEDLFFVVGNHSPSEQYSKQITSLEIFKSLNRRELVVSFLV